jgi:hypothetical protein
MGEKRNAYRILVGKPEGKRPLGRPRRKWVDNIKMDLREIVWAGADWIDMAQDRDQWRALVNTQTNFDFSRVTHANGIVQVYFALNPYVNPAGTSECGMK